MPFQAPRQRLAPVLVLVATCVTPMRALAQPSGGWALPRVAISVSPTTVVPSWYKAAEAEVRLGNAWTGGLSGGTVMGTPSGPDVTEDTPQERLVHVDALARVFFAGHPFNGWSLGGRAEGHLPWSRRTRVPSVVRPGRLIGPPTKCPSAAGEGQVSSTNGIAAAPQNGSPGSVSSCLLYTSPSPRD